MKPGDSYPPDYRSVEVNSITSSVKAGECVAVVGLSGSGKSNLLSFLARIRSDETLSFVLVDCNRLPESSTQSLFQLICRSLAKIDELQGSPDEVERAVADRLDRSPASLCILFDRFDTLAQEAEPALFGNLRALRDAHKYALTFITSTRRPLNPETELSELFYAHTLWLGPLSQSDARWTVTRYAGRLGLFWGDEIVRSLVELTSGYPALLRAACEAYADGCKLEVSSLAEHPAVQRRVAEFWVDRPGEAELRLSGLLGQPLLLAGKVKRSDGPDLEEAELTAKEHLLLAYFRAHPRVICEKDDLIRAAWPEDRIFERGVRDDSLAQLVRRLRTKIEADPSQPRLIHTVPGRGYRYMPEK